VTELLTPYQFQLRAELSARYHQQRRRVLLRRARLSQYLSLALSMGMVAAVLQQAPLPVQLTLPFMVGLLTLADTVFGFTAQAYLHESLYRRYQALQARGHQADACPADLWRELLDIEADEPPVLLAAVDLCDNELLIAHGHAPAHHVAWPWRVVTAI
jgi:hypothetical protein